MATIDGTSGDDILIGGSEDDLILGLDGDDLLEGQAGDDMLYGGNGNDILFGGPEGEANGETVTLDFNDIDTADLLEIGDPGTSFHRFEVDSTVTEDDFQLQGNLGPNAAFFHTFASDSDFFEGSTALFLNSVGGTTTLTSVDGSAFTLESIDVGEVLGVGDVTFIGTTSSGTVTQTFTLDGVDGFETLEFNDDFTDLVSVSWDQGTETGDPPSAFRYQFDNIVLAFDTGVDDGNDVLVGGNGIDELYGGTGDDELVGGRGDDLLVGGDDQDVLVGGKGNDELFGGGGDDELDGGKGSDTLDGGAGNDILTGGSGGDTFIFGPGSGNDTITDFDLGNDILSLTDGLEIDTTEDVNGDTDTLITFDSGDTVTLLGVSGIVDPGDLLV